MCFLMLARALHLSEWNPRIVTLSYIERLKTDANGCALSQDCINEDTEQRPSMKQIVDRLLAAEGLPADKPVEDEKPQPARVPAVMCDSATSL